MIAATHTSIGVDLHILEDLRSIPLYIEQYLNRRRRAVERTSTVVRNIDRFEAELHARDRVCGRFDTFGDNGKGCEVPNFREVLELNVTRERFD